MNTFTCWRIDFWFFVLSFDYECRNALLENAVSFKLLYKIPYYVYTF